ncbi:MAG: tyrosine-type recombinase/integrase [Clostridia bacterium]|nr:tyrosine-type recombinase/integrase [Clostridia bacterium]
MEAFVTYLKNEKCLSDATAASYLQDVRRFSAFLGRDAAKASREDAEAYILHMQSHGRSPATVRRSLCSLHIYYRFLEATGKTTIDPTAHIPRPENDRKLPLILTAGEAIRLMSAPVGDSPLALRDRAMLELLYATGITVSELVGLRIENINLRRRTLVLRGAHRTRTVPFGRPAAAALNEYIRKARPLLLRGGGEVALFVNYTGTPMSRQGFWKLIKKYKEQAGIDKEITPHMLRHSFAAHLLEGGADLGSIQEMMGFIDPSSTSVYTKIVENQLADVYKKAHPRAN